MLSRSGKAAFYPTRLRRVGWRAQGRSDPSLAAATGIAAIGLAVAFFVGDQKAQAVEPIEACTLYFSNGVVLNAVPVARTKAQKAKGLSGTDEVGRGMLFTWENAEPRVFWMRDTRVPLSVGFFDAEGLLFGVEDMEPETDDYHFSIKPAADALELEAGQFEQYGLVKVFAYLSERASRFNHSPLHAKAAARRAFFTQHTKTEERVRCETKYKSERAEDFVMTKELWGGVD